MTGPLISFRALGLSGVRDEVKMLVLEKFGELFSPNHFEFMKLLPGRDLEEQKTRVENRLKPFLFDQSCKYCQHSQREACLPCLAAFKKLKRQNNILEKDI